MVSTLACDQEGVKPMLRMSALGQKQTFAAQKGMSALTPKADMCSATRHVCFVPKADTRRYSITSSAVASSCG